MPYFVFLNNYFKPIDFSSHKTLNGWLFLPMSTYVFNIRGRTKGFLTIGINDNM